MELYKLSFPNGKNYIGITSRTAIHRFKEHCKSSLRPTAIRHAIQKHGIENVKLSVLAETEDWELLCLSEQEAIEKYNSKYPNGYNLTDGGEGVFGYQYSEEQKQAMSKTRKAYFLKNPDVRKEYSKRLIDLFDDPEYKANHIAKQKVWQNKPEVLAANKERGVKRFQDIEFKEKHRAKIILADNRPEVLSANRKRMIKRLNNPEFKLKIRIARKIASNRPEVKEAFKSRVLTMFNTPELKEKWKIAQEKGIAKKKEEFEYLTPEEQEKIINSRIHTEETRAKISSFHKGNKYCLGRVMSEETRKKIGDKAINRHPSDEVRNKISKANKGKKRTIETKEKIRIANINRPVSDETRHKISMSKIGKSQQPRTPIAQARNSVSIATNWAKRLNRPYSPITLITYPGIQP